MFLTCCNAEFCYGGNLSECHDRNICADLKLYSGFCIK